MLRRFSVCDVLTWVKFVAGIAIIIFGIINQDILGLIGIWPITDFFLRVFHPRYQASCEVKPRPTKKV